MHPPARAGAFFLCALRLYHGTHPPSGAQSLTASLSGCYRHNVPHTPSDSLQRARVHTPTAGAQSLTDRLSDGYRHRTPSGERQRASAATIGTRCGSMLCERLPSAQAEALPWYTPTGHALRLYHGTHPPSGAQSLTDRLSDGYRHNVPHTPSDSLSEPQHEKIIYKVY